MAAATIALDDATLARIRTDLALLERERAGVQSAQRWRVPLFIAIAVAIVILLAVAFNSFADPLEQWVSAPHVFLYVAGIVAAAFAYVSATVPVRRFEERYRERFFTILFEFVQDLRYRHDETPESFARLPRAAIGEFNRKSFDDIFEGRYEGFPFELYEAEFGDKGGATLFRGIVAAFEMPAAFDGVLVAAERGEEAAAGLFGGFFGGRIESLRSGVAAVDAVYDFRTDNAARARPLVEGNLASALGWLGEAWPEGHARVALSGFDGFLLLPLAKDFFELPSAEQAVDFDRDAKPMLADMSALLATASLVRKAGGAAQP